MVLIASVVVGLTMLSVIISERLRRQELIATGVQSQTQTLQGELEKAHQALSAVEGMASLQAKELVSRNEKIAKLNVQIAKLKSQIVGYVSTSHVEEIL